MDNQELEDNRSAPSHGRDPREILVEYNDYYTTKPNRRLDVGDGLYIDIVENKHIPRDEIWLLYPYHRQDGDNGEQAYAYMRKYLLSVPRDPAPVADTTESP